MTRNFLFLFIILTQFVYIFSGSSIAFGFATLLIISIYNNDHSFAIPKIKTTLVYILLGFVIINLYISISPLKSLSTFIKPIIITAGCYYIIDNLPKDKFTFNKNHLSIIFMLLNLLILSEPLIIKFFDHVFNYKLDLRLSIDKGTTLVLLVTPVIFCYCHQKSVLYSMLLLCGIANFIMHPMLAASIGFFLSPIAMYLVYKFNKNAINLFFNLLVAYILLAPLMFYYFLHSSYLSAIRDQLPHSWQHRLAIWQKTVALIEHNPIFGYGAGCSELTNKLVAFNNYIDIPLHPHNIFLQIWVECGAIGAVLLIFCVSLIRKHLLQLSNKLQIIYMGMGAIMLSYASISYNLWNSWLLCSIAMSIIAVRIIYD